MNAHEMGGIGGRGGEGEEKWSKDRHGQKQIDIQTTAQREE